MSNPGGQLERFRRLASPAVLFIGLWQFVRKHNAAERANAVSLEAELSHALTLALSIDNAKSSLTAICELMTPIWPNGTSYQEKSVRLGIAFQVMGAIDRSFEIIHPRTRKLPPGLAHIAAPPNWISAAKTDRLINGVYAKYGSDQLVPRGPFGRHARGRTAASADVVADRFPYLSVVSKKYDIRGTPVKLAVKVIGLESSRGVPSTSNFGNETILFTPLAEGADDLCVSYRPGSPDTFIDVKPAPGFDPVAGLSAAILRSPKQIDIALAPELTISEVQSKALPDGILAMGARAPRVLLAGTGLTEKLGDCGRSYNEARVFNAKGAELWRQRKTWPYGITRDTALRYGLKDPGVGNMLMEDIAAGIELTVADLDGLGRCLILICQDEQAESLVTSVISDFQPDWVMTPILDAGVRTHSWVHQKAFSLSSISQARFLVVSSLTMTNWPNPATQQVPFGLAIAPMTPSEDSIDVSRAYRYVSSSATSPKFGVLEWTSVATWERTVLGGGTSH